MKKGIFEVWIGNLGKYNEGDLTGEWLSLPCSQEELDSLYKKIGINEVYPETYIGDYNLPPEVDYLKDYCSDFVRVEDLNMIAALIEQYKPNADVMQACMANNTNLTFTEIGNMIVQADEIAFHDYDFQGMQYAHNMTNEEKYAYTVTEQSGLYQKLTELDIEHYVDFDELGRDFAINNEVDLYDNGYFNAAEDSLDLECYSKEELLEMAELPETEKKLQEELQKEETAPKL